jgi:hypothetical protein
MPITATVVLIMQMITTAIITLIMMPTNTGGMAL